MKNRFLEPSVELVKFDMLDILTVSGGLSSEDLDINETPRFPFAP